jgi:g-D-glutamyl-meso-diaminopimelate peptidase
MKYLNSVEEIFAMASNLQEKYDFLNSEVIGSSLCGQKILGLKIGNAENMILFACAFHGMEWLTSLVILKFLDTLCGYIHNNENVYGIDIAECLENRGLYIIPCVNPDGVEISLTGKCADKKFESIIDKVSRGKTTDWQSNARGVDINHNFDANWLKLHTLEKLNKISGPAKTRYGGKYPESEPETRAITRLCRDKNFVRALAFHIQG